MRFIDADAINTKTFVDFVGNQGYISFGDALWMISEQPTAYDVEAVVKELEEAKKDISNITTLGDCFKVGYRKGINEAIEIVKGGVK